MSTREAPLGSKSSLGLEQRSKSGLLDLCVSKDNALQNRERDQKMFPVQVDHKGCKSPHSCC